MEDLDKLGFLRNFDGRFYEFENENFGRLNLVATLERGEIYSFMMHCGIAPDVADKDKLYKYLRNHHGCNKKGLGTLCNAKLAESRCSSRSISQNRAVLEWIGVKNRRKRLGCDILGGVVKIATDNGCDMLSGLSLKHAKKFYQHLGAQFQSPEYPTFCFDLGGAGGLGGTDGIGGIDLGKYHIDEKRSKWVGQMANEIEHEFAFLTNSEVAEMGGMNF
jgi:hypothetical protein